MAMSCNKTTKYSLKYIISEGTEKHKSKWVDQVEFYHWWPVSICLQV